MDQRILIFRIIFILIIFFFNTILQAKTINGKAKVIDGDTIHINKNKIRLHGIDAPEKEQKCNLNDKEWLCGITATIELQKIINNKNVICKIKGRDKYQRYIGICFANNINLNKKMVEKGWAIAYRYYSLDYIKEEKEAIKNENGIWISKFTEPYIFRKSKKK